jgi:flagellar hook-basal body complex protein FliE
MSITLFDAASAYGLPSRAIAPIAKPNKLTPAPAPATEAGFGDMVGSILSSTATQLGKAEHASIKQVAGKGDLIDVVTAVGAAETALDTMIAVRDRVVNAYGEIMRMQI